MDSLLLFLLLLGGTPDRSSIDTPRSQAQAIASARILRGEAIDFATPANRHSVQAARDGRRIFQIAPIRSTAAVASADGGTIQLQEFH